MCQSSNSIALETAKTGIVQINTANPNLNGQGTLGKILSGGDNGTKVGGVKIIATGNTTPGMVRLFLGVDSLPGDISLVAEVPISTTQLTGTIPALDTSVGVNLDIPAGYALYASTQNNESFNIFAEGTQLEYPAEPTTCCNFKEESAEVGLGTVTTANPNRDGTGAIITVFTSPNGKNGTMVSSIQVSSVSSTSEGMVRLFISNDSGSTWSMFQEIWIPPSAQSSTIPSYKTYGSMLRTLEEGCLIGASTQNGDDFAITVNGSSWVYA